MVYKTLNVKPETMTRFRSIGKRGESDDTVINSLIELFEHNKMDLGY